MQKKSKAQSSAFTTPLPLSGTSKSLAISTKPVKFNTPNSSSNQSAMINSSTSPSTQDTKRGTRVQTDIVREAQQIPYKTEINMKDKDEKRKFRYKKTNRDYGATNNSGQTSFSYDTQEMFNEALIRRPKIETYSTKKVSRVSRDVSVNLSTIALPPGFPSDDNTAKRRLKTESTLWLSYSKTFNLIRSNAYKIKRNDSFAYLTKRNLWDYWTTLSTALALYSSVVKLLEGAKLYPGNWSLETISLMFNANPDLLRWIEVLGQILNDRVLPNEYTKAIMWHSTPKFANNCPKSNIIMTLPNADMISLAESGDWNDDNGFISGIVTSIVDLVNNLRDVDDHNRIDSLLRSVCSDRINLDHINGVNGGFDPAFTEMFANDTVRLVEGSGARMYPVLASANNDERISYYVANSVKSPTFGAYFNTAVADEGAGNAAKGESITWFRRMLYLNPSESNGDKTFETNVFNGTSTDGGSFKWVPRNSIVENLHTPSCHIITTSPNAGDENMKFISTARAGMQAVDYFTPGFQHNSFSDFITKILSVNLTTD